MRKQHSLSVLRRLLTVLALVLALRHWVCTPVVVIGESMAPTLRSGTIAVVNRVAYISHPPQRGDVVAIWTGRELMIKRILGLPGEEIALRDDTLFVNGQPLAESYVRFRAPSDIAPGRLSRSSFVVAGDNRRDTAIAVINRDRILGRLVMWGEPKAPTRPASTAASRTIRSASRRRPSRRKCGKRNPKDFCKIPFFLRLVSSRHRTAGIQTTTTGPL